MKNIANCKLQIEKWIEERTSKDAFVWMFHFAMFALQLTICIEVF